MVKNEKLWDSLGVNPAFFLEFFRGQADSLRVNAFLTDFFLGKDERPVLNRGA